MTTIGTMSSPRWRTVGVSIIVVRDEMGFSGNPGSKDIIPLGYVQKSIKCQSKNQAKNVGALFNIKDVVGLSL